MSDSLSGSAARIIIEARQLLGLARPDLACELATLALRIHPATQGAHGVIAASLEALGRHDEALAHWRDAARLAPRSHQEQFNLALALLAREDYEAGWPLYEARLDNPTWTPWAVRSSIARHQDRRLRPGDELDGRTILVFTEQGLGDMFMFARYIPVLAAHGAQVTLACRPELRPIFERVSGIQRLLSPPPGHADGKLNLSALSFDRFAPLMSLPYVFGTTPETIPHALPYVVPEPARVAAWRDRFRTEGRPGHRKVGLVIEANPASASAAARSMRPEDVAKLLANDGIDIVNLQMGTTGRALTEMPPHHVIDPLREPLPLDEFAAALAATDLLLTVDTMAAHCAGAMGHPVWVALPIDPAWHWGLTREDSPWYPHARLFRQQHPGTWASVSGCWNAALRRWLTTP